MHLNSTFIPRRGGQVAAPLFIALILLVGAMTPPDCLAAAITPFYTQNQSPLVQIFGLPAAGNAVVSSPGRGEALLAHDLASNYTQSAVKQSRESILLDGESERTTLAFRYGLANGVEMGIDLPLIGHSGGFLDAFIEGWHDFFGLPQGGRKEAAHGQLIYSYHKDGNEVLRMDHSSYGLGDLRLSGAMQLYDDSLADRTALAVRTSLKLPTGSTSSLHGSGSTDLALWLTGSHDRSLEAWGHWATYAALGGMVLSDGKVLRKQQENLVGFGTIGIGWSPVKAIAFKTQLSGHTPFYGGSQLAEVGESALQLIIGGTIALSEQTSLDLGVSEDIAVATSPDVAFHLALSKHF